MARRGRKAPTNPDRSRLIRQAATAAFAAPWLTPGGLSDSMKDIIQHILSSAVPVAVYVSPTGARGASAGFFILLSADIAAMGPGTHTGAASPLIGIGGYPVAIDETWSAIRLRPER